MFRAALLLGMLASASAFAPSGLMLKSKMTTRGEWSSRNRALLAAIWVEKNLQHFFFAAMFLFCRSSCVWECVESKDDDCHAQNNGPNAQSCRDAVSELSDPFKRGQSRCSEENIFASEI